MGIEDKISENKMLEMKSIANYRFNQACVYMKSFVDKETNLNYCESHKCPVCSVYKTRERTLKTISEMYEGKK